LGFYPRRRGGPKSERDLKIHSFSKWNVGGIISVIFWIGKHIPSALEFSRLLGWENKGPFQMR